MKGIHQRILLFSFAVYWLYGTWHPAKKGSNYRVPVLGQFNANFHHCKVVKDERRSRVNI